MSEAGGSDSYLNPVLGDTTDLEQQQADQSDGSSAPQIRQRIAGPFLRGRITSQTMTYDDSPLPSWFDSTLEYPADLFHTLTPISSSRMLARSYMTQSTPYDRLTIERMRVTAAERSDPMGGDDDIGPRLSSVPPSVRPSMIADDKSQHSSDEENAYDRPRPPLVGEAASSEAVQATPAFATVDVGEETDSQDDIADKVADILQKTHLPGSNTPSPPTIAPAVTQPKVVAEVGVHKPIPVTVTRHSKSRNTAANSIGVQTTQSFLAALKKKPMATVPKELIVIDQEQQEKRRKLQSKRTNTEPINTTDSATSISFPAELRPKPQTWFVPFEPKQRPEVSPAFMSVRQQTTIQISSHKPDQQSTRKGENRQLPTKLYAISSNNGTQTQDEINLKDAFEQRRPNVLKRIERRSEYINVKAHSRKETAERRRINAAQLFRLELETRKHLEAVQREEARQRTVLPEPIRASRGLVTMKRVFTHKQMREQTERIYSQLPEVKEKIRLKKKAEDERTYRLMAQVYTNRVKQLTLRGKIDFPITKNIIIY